MEQPERPVRHDAAMAVVILLLGFLLLALGLFLLGQWKVSAAHNQALMFGDAVGFAATAMGLGIVAWWMSSFLLAFVSALFQKSGHSTGARLTGRLSPLFMRRLALAVLGLNLLGAPLAQASPNLVEAAWAPVNASSSINPAWTPLPHTEEASAKHLALEEAGAQPVALKQAIERLQGTSPGPDAGVGQLEPGWKPRPPLVEPGLMGPKVTRAAQQTGTPGHNKVVVMRGDSLWSIAARDLGPEASDIEIAMHWPRWYAANKDVIGEDPGVIVPGQILQSPRSN